MTSPPSADPRGPSAPFVDELAALYVWGLPLVAMHRTRDGQLAAVGPVQHRDTLADATSRAVVAPNNDTLYSSSWFDLRDGDLVIDVAPLDRPDRYWSVMLLDAYTHVQYVSRRTHGNEGTSVRVTLASTAGSTAEGSIAVATPTVWVLVRVLVDSPDDLDAARRAQHRVVVHQETVTRRTAGAADPVGVAPQHAGFFADLAAAVVVDPPAPGQAPPPPGALDALRNALADPSSGDLLAAAVAAGAAQVSAEGSGADTFGNGWGTRRRGADFGDDIAYRAAFARVSLAGHLPAENRGYNRGVDGSVPQVLRFPPGGDPPVRGFWSLTLYGPDLFFVANDIDRFSIGDRTSGIRRDPDGGLTITISHEPPLDADGHPDRSNWLPAPDGPAVIVLRCYEGAADVVDATWFPPALGDGPGTVTAGR